MSHAVLPLKDLVQAKTRLSGVLRPSERRALAQAMVEDVLSVLASHPEIDAITLVSDDPVAHLLADGFAVRWLPESELGCRGLNAVIETVVDQLLAAGEHRLLVLHGDLPTLTAEDISAVLAQQRAVDGLVIGADLAATGTNLLAFGAAHKPGFRFGADSCRAHREWAEAAGVAAVVVQRPGIAFDVDEVGDLARLLGPCEWPAGARTAALLRSWPGQRIEAALASLATIDGTQHRGRAEQ